MSGNEYIQKKKPFMEKNTEDVRRVWEHSLTYADTILKWSWLQQISYTSVCYNRYIVDGK